MVERLGTAPRAAAGALLSLFVIWCTAHAAIPQRINYQGYLANAASQPVTASVTSGAATAGPPTFSGNEMIVPLSGVANQQYVTVGAGNVAGSDGSTGGSASVRIGFLLGDVSGNRVVTVSDIAQVNTQIAQPVTAANYLKDVNASGTLSVADKGIANTQITRALPAP